MSKKSRKLRAQLQAAEDRLHQLESQLPQNDPQYYEIWRGVPRTPIDKARELVNELRQTSWDKAVTEFERQTNQPFPQPIQKITAKDARRSHWDDVTNGKLTREDVTTREDRRLQREWKDWIQNGNREEFLNSLDEFGVDDIDIDWAEFYEAYHALNG